MELLTFYAYLGRRGAKIPIMTIDHFPTDWFELKQLLTEALKKAYEDYGTLEAIWTLEKHVSSKFKVWRPRIGSYTPKPFSHKRNFEAYFHAIYNPTTGQIEIKQAAFAGHTDILTDYLAMEKGKKWRLPQVIPKTFKPLTENPAAIFTELSALRYPDYSRTPRLKYDKQTREQTLTHPRTYMPWGAAKFQ